MSKRDQPLLSTPQAPAPFAPGGRSPPRDKQPRPGEPVPNLSDHAAACRDFSYASALAALSLPPAKGPNIAFEASDRAVLENRGEQVALRWLTDQGLRLELTYRELALLSSRFANVLQELEVQPGQVVCTLLDRVPAHYAVALGTLKHRAVFAPLACTLSAEALGQQLEAAAPRVVITSRRLYRTKLEPVRGTLCSLEHVLLIDDDAGVNPALGTLAYGSLLRSASAEYAVAETAASDPALMHFGTEPDARPEPRVHTHEAAVLQRASGHYAIDLHPGDVYYPALEPGSLLWTAYAVIAPLTNRATVVLDRAEFSPARCYRVIAAERVNVFLASAEAVRKLVQAGREPAAELDLSALRLPACPDASLEPEAVTFGEKVFGRPLHASLFEPQFGAIVIANFLALPIQPGAVGKPVPGIQAALAQSRDRQLERAPHGQGELVLRLLRDGRPTGHDDDPVLTTHGKGRWFATGRQAWCDAEGNFWLTPVARPIDAPL